MSDLVLDTHALVWYLRGSPQLSAVALKEIREALSAGHALHISVISLAEML